MGEGVALPEDDGVGVDAIVLVEVGLTVGVAVDLLVPVTVGVEVSVGLVVAVAVALIVAVGDAEEFATLIMIDADATTTPVEFFPSARNV